MNAPRFFLAALAVVVLSGCSAFTPEPTVAPATVGEVVPESQRTPEPTPEPTATWASGKPIPGTELKAGPTPGTALGPTGRVLRYVPADPTWTPKCRPLTKSERDDLETYVHVGTGWDGISGRAEHTPVAVDLPEDGWAVLAYWSEPLQEFSLGGAVRGGGATSGVGTAWPGSHTHGGVAFADGPEALRAALECAEAQA